MRRLFTSAALFLCSLLTFAQFSGSGSGTEDDPYLILNPIQLNQIRNFLNKSGVYFKMMTDIDLTEFLEDENPTQGWQPVGTSSSPFRGVLDGNDHTIIGLWIERSNSDNVGLFGWCSGATIKNLSVIDASIKGGGKIGVLSGVGNGTIQDCFVSGKVEGVSTVGGCVGHHNGRILNVLSKVEVFGGDNTGGITGYGEIFSDCSVYANISGTDSNIGGITGQGGGKITNCKVISEINGANYTGGICGHGGGGIFNSTFIGTIQAKSYVGGISGDISCNLYGCVSIADIVGNGSYIGGLIGKSYNYTINNCYYNGHIDGHDQVGGLIGYKTGGEVYNCYSKSSVTGTDYVGGLFGKMEGCTVKSNVSLDSSVKAAVGNFGRICGGGTNISYGQIGTANENKAWNKMTVICQGVAQDIFDDSQNGTSVSTTTLKLKATYVAMGWDFNDVWAIQETESFPYFKRQTAPPVITSNLVSGAMMVSGKCIDGGLVTLEIDGTSQQMTSSGNQFSFTVSPLQAGHEVRVCAKAEGLEQSYYTTQTVSYLGKGTEQDPYQIYTAADLKGVYCKGFFKLMNNIDLTDYINQFSPTEGWESIGRDGSETIHFDGNGYKITGLWCNSTRNNTGLFSCFANGTIKNLTVETANGKLMKGGKNTGILIGKMVNGTIEDCHVKGAIVDGSPVGGLVGLMDNGRIYRCETSVTMTTQNADTYMGGLVGEMISGEISQCYTSGKLTGTGASSYIGGLVGKNSATVTNSHSEADVASSYNAAGLIAYNYGIVDKCYANGNLFSNNYAAGVVGYNDGTDAVVSNCAAMNNKIEIIYESQQSQQGGGYGQRIIGGIKNGAPAPALNNVALNTMQVSVNEVAQKVYDDIMNGIAKPQEELMTATTYQTLGWDFSSIWGIDENEGYPYLLWPNDVVPVSEITLNKTSATLSVGSTLTLTANILPADATNAQLVWSSSNEDVATISEGIVTARQPGTATITATATDGSGVSASCVVTVILDYTDLTAYDNVIYVEEQTVSSDTQSTLSVKMNNEMAVRGFQFDLVLPDGITLAEDEDGLLIVELSTERTTPKKMNYFDYALQGDGSLRVLCNSSGAYTFDGNSGEVCTITIQIGNLEGGEYPIILKNIILTDVSAARHSVGDAIITRLTISDFTLGDVNNDSFVDVSDLALVGNHILGRETGTFVFKAADVNNDNEIDVSDLAGVANIILYGGVSYSPRAKGPLTSFADLSINVPNVNVLHEGRVIISVALSNPSEEVASLQMDLQIPEGFRMKGVNINDDRCSNQYVEYEIVDDDVVRVLCVSPNNRPLKGWDGEIMTVELEAPSNLPVDSYPLTVNNAILTSWGNRMTAPDVTVLMEMGNTTAITEWEVEGKSNDNIYGIDGTRQSQPQRGINIVRDNKGNAHKIIKKK